MSTKYHDQLLPFLKSKNLWSKAMLAPLVVNRQQIMEARRKGILPGSAAYPAPIYKGFFRIGEKNGMKDGKHETHDLLAIARALKRPVDYHTLFM